MELVVGHVVRAHGIRGEVLVAVRTDEPAERFAVGSVLATDPADAGPLTVEFARPHTSAGRSMLIVAFEEIADRTEAEDLKGTVLGLDDAEIPSSDDPDEFHDHQLVGLSVRDVEGAEIGTVARIDHGPGADMLIVKRPGARDALVPFVRAIVPEVDVAAGVLVVTPPEGLFEL